MPKYVEISVDEMLQKRADCANDDGILFKGVASAKSWNPEDRSAVFTMSAETVDRYGDVVVQKGIDLEHFNKNPIAFFNHRSFDTPIGAWSGVKTVNGSPKRTEGKMTFTAEGVDDVADKVARHVASGTIKASSIGFRPKAVERIMDDDDNWTYGYRFPEIELYECSVVTVPAVREALIKGATGEVDIHSPEVIEEFLETLSSNKGLASLVDRKLFEKVYQEITGNKTSATIQLGDDVLNEPIKLVFDQIKVISDRISVLESNGNDEASDLDPVEQEIQKRVDDIAEEIQPKVDEIDDEDRKGNLSRLLSKIKSVFLSEEKPEVATDEAKQSVSDRYEEIMQRRAA